MFINALRRSRDRRGLTQGVEYGIGNGMQRRRTSLVVLITPRRLPVHCHAAGGT
jgi:hypothetical protein